MNGRCHTYISVLSSDVLLEVFADLDAVSLCQASLTCKQWYQIISQSETLWKIQALKITDEDAKSQLLKSMKEGKSWKVRNSQLIILVCLWVGGGGIFKI